MAAPKIELGGQVMPPPPPPAALLPKQLIRTNVFSTGIPEPQTRAPEIKSGETGGFGDSGGLESRSAGGQPVTIAQLGGFDLPPGSGSGRTGLSQGGSRAGFAAEAEPRSETRPNLPAPVHPAGFGDAGTNAGTQARAEPAEITGTLPAEIISKPMPVYPDEARRLGIEGEVLLEVRFESTGKLQVVRVVRGLGHGLDEAAIHAARQIRFKPALRDGQPADSTGMLHISFQIA
jgi:TonB family protein